MTTAGNRTAAAYFNYQWRLELEFAPHRFASRPVQHPRGRFAAPRFPWSPRGTAMPQFLKFRLTDFSRSLKNAKNPIQSDYLFGGKVNPKADSKGQPADRLDGYR